MAVITSTLLNRDAINDADYGILGHNQTNANNNLHPVNLEEQALLPTQNLSENAQVLAEIEALQEAMENDPDFDFNQMEATAAGSSSDPSFSGSTEKSVSNPLVIETNSLEINFRSGSADTGNTPQTSNATSSSQAADAYAESPYLFSSTTNLTSNLIEDFITSQKGQFADGALVAEQVINTQWGVFTSDGLGSWHYSLNNHTSQVQALAAGNKAEDRLELTTISGQKLTFTFDIQGANDQAVITGTKTSSVQAETLDALNTQASPSISGSLTVNDIDAGEARFQTQFDIRGNYGHAEINALGEWHYTLNNHDDVVLSLRQGEILLDTFSVKTLDGTKQLIQISIEGVNDKPLLTGNNVVELDLGINTLSSGKLSITDPDFGESSFQSQSGIQSKLGYGKAQIDSQGNWRYELDSDYFSQNPFGDGQTKVDSFTVFTADGSQQDIHIPMKGSDNPFYAQGNHETLSIESLLVSQDHDELSFLNERPTLSAANDGITTNGAVESAFAVSNEPLTTNTIHVDLPLG